VFFRSPADLSRSFPSRLKNATKLDSEASVALLMHDDRLIDETPGARQLLQIQSGQSVAWAEVHSAFTVRFPSLPDEFQIAMSQAPTQIPSRLPHDSACLMLEAAGAGLRLSLIQESDDNCVVLHHEAIQDQISLNTLTRAIAMAPFAVWMVDSSNEHASQLRCNIPIRTRSSNCWGFYINMLNVVKSRARFLTFYRKNLGDLL